MKSLDEAIRRFALQPESLAPPSMSKREEKRQRLIADLQAISHKNGKLAWIIVGSVLCLFLVCLELVLCCGDLVYAKIAQCLLGVSAAGCVGRLKDLWSEKSTTELLLRLAAELDGDEFKQIIEVLAQKLIAGHRP